MSDVDTKPLTCLEKGPSCRGEVQYREPLSASGKSFARCTGHWSKRLDLQEGNRRSYPDSDVPPAWFDPSYAGESWNEPE